MPRPRFRSRSLSRGAIKSPGGRRIVHYRRDRSGGGRCTICGNILHGVPRLRSPKIRKTAKTSRRPERPYGGYLCSGCLKRLLKEEARNISWPEKSQ